MRSVGIATVLLAAYPATAATCIDALQNLQDEWYAASVPTPPKPSAHVIAKNGREYTGGQVQFMIAQIRLANIDCKEGRNDAALKRADKVRGLLKSAYASR